MILPLDLILSTSLSGDHKTLHRNHIREEEGNSMNVHLAIASGSVKERFHIKVKELKGYCYFNFEKLFNSHNIRQTSQSDKNLK